MNQLMCLSFLKDTDRFFKSSTKWIAADNLVVYLNFVTHFLYYFLIIILNCGLITILTANAKQMEAVQVGLI